MVSSSMLKACSFSCPMTRRGNSGRNSSFASYLGNSTNSLGIAEEINEDSTQRLMLLTRDIDYHDTSFSVIRELDINGAHETGTLNKRAIHNGVLIQLSLDKVPCKLSNFFPVLLGGCCRLR